MHLMFFTSLPDFMRVWPGLTDFTDFQVLTPILHILYPLTRKIVRFYKSKRIFNNHDLQLYACYIVITLTWQENVWQKPK